jgi:AraC-like DNA-binding protein
MERLGKKAVKPSLEELGLSPETLASSDRRVSHRAAIDLLKESIRVAERPDLGILAAEEVKPSELEIWEYAMRSQPDVAHALESMSRLLALLHDGSRMDIERTGDTVTIRWTMDPGLERFFAMSEFAMGMAFVAWRRVINSEKLGISDLFFPHAEPPDLEPYEKLFQCTLHFNAPFLGLRLPSKILERRMPHADTILANMLDRHANDLIEKLPKPGFAHRVQELITEGLTTGTFGTEHVAKRLHMSSRTLHRRLKQEDNTFRELLDDVRHHLAARYLLENQFSISEIALLLGFSSSNAFHKAFKRWTGSAVGTYVQNARGSKV